jgi:hypothetical protein
VTAAQFLFDPTNTAAARTAARLGAKSNSPGRAVLHARSADDSTPPTTDEHARRIAN